MEGFASVFYISNKSRLLAFAATTRGRIPEIDRRGVNAVFAAPARSLELSERVAGGSLRSANIART